MTGQQTAGETSQAKAQEAAVSTQQVRDAAPESNATSNQNQPGRDQRDWIDQLVTILFISGGTEGLNALLKFLNYKKETAKGSAAKSQSEADSGRIKGKDALTVVRNT